MLPTKTSSEETILADWDVTQGSAGLFINARGTDVEKEWLQVRVNAEDALCLLHGHERRAPESWRPCDSTLPQWSVGTGRERSRRGLKLELELEHVIKRRTADSVSSACTSCGGCASAMLVIFRKSKTVYKREECGRKNNFWVPR